VSESVGGGSSSRREAERAVPCLGGSPDIEELPAGSKEQRARSPRWRVQLLCASRLQLFCARAGARCMRECPATDPVCYCQPPNELV
jgi:hypothetical protein